MSRKTREQMMKEIRKGRKDAEQFKKWLNTKKGQSALKRVVKKHTPVVEILQEAKKIDAARLREPVEF